MKAFLICLVALAQGFFIDSFKFAGGATETKPSTNNLVEFWEMTNTVTAGDEIGAHRGYTLDANGSITDLTGVDGGLSRHMEGTLYFDSNLTADLIRKATNNLTFCAFIKWNGGTPTGNKVVASVFDTGGSERSFYFGLNASEQARFIASTNGSDIDDLFQPAPVNSDTNSFYFLAARRNGASLDIVMVKVGDALPSFTSLPITTNPLHESAADFLVGASFSSGSPSSYWQGDIDKVVFYNVALSDAEVRWIYNESGGGTGRTYNNFLP